MDNQFGFNPNHSIDMCVYDLKEIKATYGSTKLNHAYVVYWCIQSIWSNASLGSQYIGVCQGLYWGYFWYTH